ncbi:MAG: hypothetical protein CM1200mP2_31210 [Planctomycetaceae bacterium]|nr:MAG: hypothetical protein CM1200mP2_31210 [Planctomycetaceae bacterium]
MLPRRLSRSQQLLEPRPRASIGHVLLLQPRPAGLAHAPLHHVHSAGAVRVGADHDRNPVVTSRSGVNVVEIQPAGMRVDLHHHPVVGRRLEQARVADLRPRTLPISRPLGCPMTSTWGFCTAVISRASICSRGCLSP